MAKLMASEVCNRVAKDAIQVLGGNGYITDYPVERQQAGEKLEHLRFQRDGLARARKLEPFGVERVAFECIDHRSRPPTELHLRAIFMTSPRRHQATMLRPA